MTQYSVGGNEITLEEAMPAGGYRLAHAGRFRAPLGKHVDVVWHDAVHHHGDLEVFSPLQKLRGDEVTPCRVDERAVTRACANSQEDTAATGIVECREAWCAVGHVSSGGKPWARSAWARAAGLKTARYICTV